MMAVGPAAALVARLRLTPEGDRAATVSGLVRPDAPRVLGFINAHAVNLCAANASAWRDFMAADVLLRDGVGVKLMLRLLGRAPGANMNGTDLIPELMARPGLRVAFYGGRPGVAETAAEKVAANGVNIVAARHGYATEADYLRWMEEDAPDLLILAMGMPMQEALALKLRGASRCPRLIVCGGAILDFIAGRVSRAPRWMRRLGLEWAFRLAQEPRRLFHRYVIGNPLFVLRALVLALAPRKPAPAPMRVISRPAARPAARPVAASEKTSPAMTA
jgi:exopolysaccharide biosynthesis WecB/TagA/CpsF family protein